MKRGLQLKIRGAVQGVGFRPFVYRLATELGLTGWVQNSSTGVTVAVEGEPDVLETFLLRLSREKPALALIQEIQSCWQAVIGYNKFQIKASVEGAKTALILPDIATCPQCQREIFDPTNRRYRYPFTNCTNCGPRFTIITALPYDRPKTTMQQFEMCDRCRVEYQNPLDRRFHAQPNACPECGPHLELWDRQGNALATHHRALLATAEAIRQGKILAIKGLGGFHLVVDAANEAVVKKLRDRKHRPHKPLALMYPSLERIKADCHVSSLEEKLLLSPQAAIVLLKKQNYACEWVAPHNSCWGVMLPYTPLHHLLMSELDFPIVATSGNFSGEPICIDNREALTKLGRIADLFLVHNRPILRPVDDSIVRVVGGREQILRRARGYAPLPMSPSPVSLDVKQNEQLLAVGGYLKSAIAFTKDNQLFLSQYIGDLETLATYERFQQTINNYQSLYELKPTKVICDRHPHYLSTNYAQKLNISVASVQHHYAHVLSCMVDNGLDLNEPILGVAWDGTGYGLDGTIWGGEFLSITNTGFTRVAHLRTFCLPGGERAIKQPTRIAIALLYKIFGDFLFTNTNCFNYLPWFKALTERELKLFHTLLDKNINAPITSSMGRLFDGVAAILSICQQVSYEGQAAIELESAIAELNTKETYSFELIQSADKAIIVDWEKIIREILTDITERRSQAEISARFHNTLIEIIVAVTKRVKQKQIVLTGGCWQNKYLTEKAIARLQQEDLIPYWHHGVPCNDSGIAVGQIAASLK